MFGFTRPICNEIAEYRHYYSRLCQFHRHIYGNLSAFYHSFDSVLLYMMGADAGFFEKASIPPQQCCRLKTIKQPLSQLDFKAAEYCSSTSMLFSMVKLQDNIQDSKGLSKKWAQLLFLLQRRRVALMRQYFDRIDGQILPQISAAIAAHSEVESLPAADVTIECFALPTARGFSSLFSGFANACDHSHNSDTFARLGSHIGSAIVLGDGVRDWKSDLRRSQFNPIHSADDQASAVALVSEHLRRATEICREEFGKDSLSGNVLLSVDRRFRQAFSTDAQPCLGESCITGQVAPSAQLAYGCALPIVSMPQADPCDVCVPHMCWYKLCCGG